MPVDRSYLKVPCLFFTLEGFCIRFCVNKVAEIKTLIISDSWASKPNVAVGQMNLLVIQTIFLHTVPKTGCLFIFILIACKTLTLFPLPNPSSPSSLRSGIMSSRRLLLFITLRTQPGQVQVGSGHAALITKMHVIGCAYHMSH